MRNREPAINFIDKGKNDEKLNRLLEDERLSIITEIILRHTTESMLKSNTAADRSL